MAVKNTKGQIEAESVYPYDGLANHNTQSTSSLNNKDLSKQQQKTATKAAFISRKSYHDLQEIIESWNHLPAYIKAVIKTLIKNAKH